MAKIVILELGFEDDEDAEEFAKSVKDATFANAVDGYGLPVGDVIDCRVENP